MSPRRIRRSYESFCWGGVQQVRVVLRALALLQLAQDASATQIAKVVPLTAQAIRRLGHRYQVAGLDGPLYERQRPGAAETTESGSPWFGGSFPLLTDRRRSEAFQFPPEHRLVRPEVHQPSRLRQRRSIRRLLLQAQAQKLSHAQRVGYSVGDARSESIPSK